MKLLFRKAFGGFIAPLALFAFACEQTPKAETKYISPAIKNNKISHPKFTPDGVDNKLDPSCMMPLTAGIGDTLHYKGLVLGFCSSECKKDFFKDPAANLVLAQLKKKLKH